MSTREIAPNPDIEKWETSQRKDLETFFKLETLICSNCLLSLSHEVETSKIYSDFRQTTPLSFHWLTIAICFIHLDISSIQNIFF